MTKVVTESLAQCRESEAGEAVWTGIAILLAIGALFTVLLFSFSHWLVVRFIKLPAALENETLSAIYWLAISVPVITVTAGLRGVLEAQHRFRLVNIVRIVMGAFELSGPAGGVTIFHKSCIRLLHPGDRKNNFSLIHFVLAAKCLPALLHRIVLERRALSRLMTTGCLDHREQRCSPGPNLRRTIHYRIFSFRGRSRILRHSLPNWCCGY